MTVTVLSRGEPRSAGLPALWVGLRHALAWPVRVHRARQTLRALANLDEHGLRDIGLSGQDLRDAVGLPIGEDPSVLLARRAAERRRSWRAGRIA